MTSYSDCLPSSSLTVDTSQGRYFDEDDVSILDDGILDSSLPSSDAFSPTIGGVWKDFPDHEIIPKHNSSNAFNRDNPFPFAQPQSTQGTTSGSCTPTGAYDARVVDVSPLLQFLSGSEPGTETGSLEMTPTGRDRTSSATAFPSTSSTGSSIPPSPHTTQDWVSSQSNDPYEPRAIPRRMRHGNAVRSHSPLLRRDGIRKKNARFEIPAERNLFNIDHLISQTTDEQEIKELKQQKRLLRNRQAALDSRQRKKQHTERLEEEKKAYTTIISELEDRVAELEIREDEQLRMMEDWKAKEESFQHYIEALHMEKEEMVRSHTLETGQLRKKNAFLTEHAQKMESIAMSTCPSSSGFSADFANVDPVGLDGHCWDQFSALNDFPIKSETEPASSLHAPAKEANELALRQEDKPAATGLLLILLLCGAFVASSNSTTSRPNIPRMPDEIRAASATVLDNIFKDAGIHHVNPQSVGASHAPSYAPAATASAWSAAPSMAPIHEHPSHPDTTMDFMDLAFLHPSKEQEHEQLFSLTPSQYNGITSDDYLGDRTPPQELHGRRYLQAGLAALRSDGAGSAAEVYTRSLLWDKVPTQVVRDFAKLVAASNGPDEMQSSG
ncbi:MAG: hypothetical protein M1817_002477 [Caeruleum heppii]|nr:MAG: hypothetical protein M1817_002477 [Caeruleum heppii]